MMPVVSRQIGRLARRLRRERTDWVVLLYHRVADLTIDPWALSVTPAHFDEQLAVLSRWGRPTRLVELDEMLRRGERPRRSVVITFDDGYADNLYQAYPILERHGVPATVFVSSGPLTDRRGFWWDQLERALLRSGPVPRSLSLSLHGEQRTWDLGDAADGLPGGLATDRWLAWEKPPTARHALFFELWETLRRMHADERRHVLETVLRWAGLGLDPGPVHETLTAAEVRTLAAGGLIEIGSHSVTHSALSSLSRAEQEDELARSKASLEAVVGRPVESLAYPFGQRVDYLAETLAVARSVGYARACNATGERPGRRVDRFDVPRVHVRDLSGPAFEAWLLRWFDD